MSDDLVKYPDRFPPGHAHVLLHGPVGDLEALTDEPEPDGDNSGIAVLCPRLAAEGGTMHSKVVQMLARALREMGLHTVRMNYRGMGISEGAYDGGQGESEDLLAVVQWSRQVCPGAELWLGGFEFGAYVSARAAGQLSLGQLISIAPPVEDFDFQALQRPDCPWLVIQGDEDERVSPEAVYQWVEGMQENPPQLIRMQEAGHLFHRRLMDLRGVIKNGVRRQRRQQTGD